MTQTQTAPAPAQIQRFVITTSSGTTSDLTELIYSGAKLTVLYQKLCDDSGIRYNLKRAEYYQLRRQVFQWEKAGLVTITKNCYQSNFIGINERPGIFVRCANDGPKTYNLIKGLQNSKCLAGHRYTAFSDSGEQLPELQEPYPDYPEYRFPGGRISWLRMQAIKRCMEIDDPRLFVRETRGNQKVLNHELETKHKWMLKLFNTWIAECRKKTIVLRNANGSPNAPAYIELPYKTRFTDIGRHIENEKTYAKAIELSLKQFKTGVFVTLTTDPQIQMNQKGVTFDRYVKDGDKTYHFEVEGKGGNLFSANRNESKAWRSWYENQCHRYGKRIPYIRVVEFQKNGLIHTHLLLFDIEWKTSWKKLAEEWGVQYQQGLMNKVYRIKNIDGCWHWQSGEERPDDAKGRDPADYLAKYLKKAQSPPTVKCPKCGKIHDSEGVPIQCDCGETIRPPKDYRYMYWVCGKRFFTISQCLRELDFDKIIAEEDRKAHQTTVWEFLGAPYNSKVDELIDKDVLKHPKPPATSHNGWPHEKQTNDYYAWIVKSAARAENPDENDDEPIPEEILEAQWHEEQNRRTEKEKELKRKAKERPDEINLADLF